MNTTDWLSKNTGDNVIGQSINLFYLEHIQGMARTPKVVEDRREQIIDAAMRVFARQGYANATNKDIAREAGITAGLIYHYFKSKEDLLRAAIEGYAPRRLLRSFPPEMLDLSPEQLLRKLAQQILSVAEDEHFLRLMRVYLPEVIRDPKVAPAGLSTIQTVVKFLESYLASKMESGELLQTDPALTAQVFIGSIMDLVLRRQIVGDPLALQYSHEQITEHLVTTTLQGLLPR